MVTKFGLQHRRLILSARNEQELIRVQSQLHDPLESEVVLMDMEDNSEIDHVCTNITERHKIDIVILNAGISQRGEVAHTSFETEARIMNINFHGLVRVAKQLLPRMLERGSGHYVVMSSVTGKIGVPGRATYAASKHALQGYFDSLRAEVCDSGIDVTIICPGYIHTSISQNALLADGQSQKTLDQKSKNGMDVTIFANRVLKGISNKKQEILIGGKEILGVYIKRFFPSMLNNLVKRNKE